MRSKRLYYWVLHSKAQDGLAVIDQKGVVSYLSIGRWNTLVDLVKRDFRTAKMENYLLPGNEKVTNNSIESTKRVLEQMLDNPSEIDSLRRTINYEVIFGTELQRKVWTYLVEHIPVGTTSSYSEVAKALGVKSARVVGNACGANRIALIIPCHRVLTAQGTINGYRYGKDEKERLLQLEVKK